MSRTNRRPYTKSKRIDRSCRGRDGCPWCVGNRMHANEKRLMEAKQRIVEAAIAWGNTTHDDAVALLAGEIEIVLALGELDCARQNKINPLARAIKPRTKGGA